MKSAVTVILLTTVSCSSPDGKTTQDKSSISHIATPYAKPVNFAIDKGGLSGNPINLIVNFGAIACPCAQWIETKNISDTSSNHQYFYLEPGNPEIINADTLFNGENFPIKLSLTGQFYNKVGYPENYNPPKGNPEPARVFRYEAIKILRNGR
jgi:hypothetical protein